MQRGARGCIASALHPGATPPRSTGVTKGERDEGDDCHVTRCQRGPQLAEAARARGRWLAGWAVPGPKKGVGWLVGCRPRKGKRLSYFIYPYFIFNSILNSNSNLNPHK
jgi:hypothetical protein